jgi:TonB family protein
VEGVVTVSGTIDTTGKMVNMSVVRSSDSRLDDLALAAVREWRWRPGTMDGQPTDVIFTVNVSFSTH